MGLPIALQNQLIASEREFVSLLESLGMTRACFSHLARRMKKELSSDRAPVTTIRSRFGVSGKGGGRA